MSKTDSRVCMTAYDNDLIPKAPRQYLLNVPQRAAKTKDMVGFNSVYTQGMEI